MPEFDPGDIALSLLMQHQNPDPRGRPVTGRTTTYEWRRPSQPLPEITHCVAYKIEQIEEMDRVTRRIAAVQLGPGVLPDEILHEGGTVAFLGYEWKMMPARELPWKDPWGQGAQRPVGEPVFEVELHGTAPTP